MRDQLSLAKNSELLNYVSSNFSSLKSPKSGSNVVKRKEHKKGRWGGGGFKSRPHLVKKEKNKPV